jgi:hypothetical protein
VRGSLPMAGAIATAAGSLFAGIATGLMEKAAKTPLASQRLIILLYAAFGVVLALVFRMLSPRVEVDGKAQAPTGTKYLLGIGASRGVVLRLCGLFALDAFGGGFVMQSFAAYWFYLRFGVEPAMLGGILAPIYLQESRHCWRPGSRRESGWSGRWCSHTYRQTFC